MAVCCMPTWTETGEIWENDERLRNVMQQLLYNNRVERRTLTLVFGSIAAISYSYSIHCTSVAHLNNNNSFHNDSRQRYITVHFALCICYDCVCEVFVCCLQFTNDLEVHAFFMILNASSSVCLVLIMYFTCCTAIFLLFLD